MSYDYEQTHENILNSARVQFREKGYLEASIRKICSDAGVTNGAFYSHFASKEDLFCSIVKPCIDGLNEIYSDEKETYFKISCSEDVLNSFRNAYISLEKMIRYVCDHREDFLLLLESGRGTIYEGFQDRIIDAEVESMKKLFKISSKYIKNKENISENLIRMGSAFLISTVFEGIRNGLNAEEIIHETKLVSDYCAAGYKCVFGI